jgi:hypothetical protein
MRLLTKTLLLLAAAAALAVSYEGISRRWSAPSAASAAIDQALEAGHDFAPPSGSWETLFNAGWR